MSGPEFIPTPEQNAVIGHDGVAFIHACPGAGKTRVMVERASRVFQDMPPGRGVAFLSFTKAAVSELDLRLRHRSVLPVPLFPSFIGTFDSFVWQFFIAPFGAMNTDVKPHLIPDIGKLAVTPYDGAQLVPLSCFDRSSGTMDLTAAKRAGFNTAVKKAYQIKQYETAAVTLSSRLRKQGYLGFDDARVLALMRQRDPDLSPRLARALTGRFREVIVDEAQDCNPDDLHIIAWLRDAGLPVKVICDPYQSIYEFRGGVTEELFTFRDEFEEAERKQLSGNFRSTPNICKAIVCLRPSEGGTKPDQALGKNMDLPYPVHVLSYKDRAVPASIGAHFSALVHDHGVDISACPIVAATRATAANAVGKRVASGGNAMTIRLAEAAMNFHFAPRYNQMKVAMESVHRIILELEGALSDSSYHQHVKEQEIDPLSWRSGAISLLRNLKFDRDRFADARAWHDHAKTLLEQYVSSKAAATIGRKLKWNAAIEPILAASYSGDVSAQTIHSVKGMEFPAVCVVTTTKTLGAILDYLEGGTSTNKEEEARELYVAASRAQKLLVFAVPENLSDRFATHLRSHGADVTVSPLASGAV